MMVKCLKISGLFCLLCFLLLTSCDFDLKFKDEGFKSTSINSEVSKKNKVFVDTYDFSKEFILFKHDTLKIIEAFVEHEYNRTHSGEINKWSGIQLVLVLDKKIPLSFNSEWGLKAKNKHQLTVGTGGKMMHTDLYCIPNNSFCYGELYTIELMIVQDIFTKNETVIDTILLTRR